jgi:hypothetical protein
MDKKINWYIFSDILAHFPKVFLAKHLYSNELPTGVFIFEGKNRRR